MQLPILYRDDALVAVNKPSGLLVHRSHLDHHETRFALQILRDQIGTKVYPIHRLDKPTSGVLLFALSPEVTQHVSTHWQDVQKTYLAITRGRLNSIELDYPIKHTMDNREIKSQDAVTAFECLATASVSETFGKNLDNYSETAFSLVKCQPQTGRLHQIRKHLKHLHHPIVGDTRYGRGEINRYFRQAYQLNRLMLHCQAMHLSHPITGKTLSIYASLDSHWHTLLTRMSWVAARY